RCPRVVRWAARRRGDRAPLSRHRRRHLRLHQSQRYDRDPEGLKTAFANGSRQPPTIEFAGCRNHLIQHMTDFSPREIVSELDRFIIGQGDAKRAVAIALRNRWRRLQLDEKLREEVLPKNILMIGPTGVGKTEISRRLAKLAGAPFLKVEA